MTQRQVLYRRPNERSCSEHARVQVTSSITRQEIGFGWVQRYDADGDDDDDEADGDDDDDARENKTDFLSCYNRCYLHARMLTAAALVWSPV